MILMSKTMNTGATGNNIHANVAFCKSTVTYARKGSVTLAWAMGWLNGAGCAGYRMPARLSEAAVEAYRDGQEEGRSAKAIAA